MRLRKFTGRDSGQVMRDVKKAMGEDALILGTRQLVGGGVEITAATDVDEVVEPLPEVPPPAAGALGADAARLASIESTLRQFGAQLRRVDRRIGLSRVGAGLESSWHKELAALETEPRDLAAMLAHHGLPTALALQIAEHFAHRRMGGEAFDAAVGGAIAESLPMVEGTAAANVRFLVGPTGSGKTTTVAKLAADDVLAGRETPILLMADDVRIGAAEQLGTFARLLDVPMHTIRSVSDVRKSIMQAPENSTIFVDTAGLSSEEGTGRSVKELIEACDGRASVTAVLSATAAASSLQRAWAQIDDLQPDSCALTHVDESDEPGTACSWLEQVGVPLAWIGTGQRVPDDLAPATGANLAQWLVAA